MLARIGNRRSGGTRQAQDRCGGALTHQFRAGRNPARQAGDGRVSRDGKESAPATQSAESTEEMSGESFQTHCQNHGKIFFVICVQVIAKLLIPIIPMAKSLFAPSRPRFFLDNQEQPALADALMSLTVVEDKRPTSRCALIVHVPPEASPGAFGTATFAIDRSLSVSLGEDLLFEGRVTSVTARYTDSVGENLEVSASGKRRKLAAPASPILLSLGSTLRTATVVVSRPAASASKSLFQARCQTDAAVPRLGPAQRIRIDGIESYLAGDYTTTEVQTRFDERLGLRTEIAASRTA